MSLRRSADNNARRRRVLIDESTSQTDDTAEQAGTRRSRSAAALSRNYLDSAISERQPRVTDFIPMRWWVYALWFCGSALTIALVLVLFAQIDSLGETVGHAHLTAFDLEQRGSVAGWFSSVMLAVAAAGGVIVFSIRRHKVNDYHGLYRVWIWVPMVLLMGSLDAATSVRHAVRGVSELLAKKYVPTTVFATNTSTCLLVLAIVLALAIFVRVGIEMRKSRAGMTFLIMAASGSLATAILSSGLVRLAVADHQLLAEMAAKLFADLSMMFATWTYARFVYLDATGELASNKRKAKKARVKKPVDEEKSNATSDEDASADKSSTTAAAAKKRTDLETLAKTPEPAAAKADRGPLSAFKTAAPTRSPSASSQADEDDDSDDESDSDSENDGLSRAERKRLKKLEKQGRRDQRRAA